MVKFQREVNQSIENKIITVLFVSTTLDNRQSRVGRFSSVVERFVKGMIQITKKI
jgi:hypothetical protein